MESQLRNNTGETEAKKTFPLHRVVGDGYTKYSSIPISIYIHRGDLLFILTNGKPTA